MRVLLISHTCQSRTAGQPRAERLARMPDVRLRVLIPDRWRFNGQWRVTWKPEDTAFSWRIGKVLWPWAGPAQSYLHWYPGLARIFQEFRPDIIDLWEEPWGLVSAHACWLRNRLLPHAKIVAETEQNLDKSLLFPFEQFRSYTLRNAACAVGRSREAVAVLRAKGYTGPAKTVPNAVDSELFRPLDRKACRQDILGDWGAGKFIVGYAGRLVEEKGLMDIVEALPFCPANTGLLFVGAGSFQTDLERRVHQLGKTSQVRFLPGQPMHNLPQVFNALDILALVSRTTPSWKEQFGRVIIEAHACGTPVIGSASGAIPEVVGRAGLIVPERDPAALAAAITELHRDPQWRAEMGRAGRRQVEENYTWERVAFHMSEIYREVVANAHAP
jgi:glycosyltransferase involved in cell wall biosynthesis